MTPWYLCSHRKIIHESIGYYLSNIPEPAPLLSNESYVIQPRFLNNYLSDGGDGYIALGIAIFLYSMMRIKSKNNYERLLSIYYITGEQIDLLASLLNLTYKQLITRYWLS